MKKNKLKRKSRRNDFIMIWLISTVIIWLGMIFLMSVMGMLDIIISFILSAVISTVIVVRKIKKEGMIKWER